MKTSLTVLVLVLLLSILAGCAPGPNPSRKMASEHGECAGFLLGLLREKASLIGYIEVALERN